MHGFVALGKEEDDTVVLGSRRVRYIPAPQSGINIPDTQMLRMYVYGKYKEITSGKYAINDSDKLAYYSASWTMLGDWRRGASSLPLYQNMRFIKMAYNDGYYLSCADKPEDWIKTGINQNMIYAILLNHTFADSTRAGSRLFKDIDSSKLIKSVLLSFYTAPYYLYDSKILRIPISYLQKKYPFWLDLYIDTLAENLNFHDSIAYKVNANSIKKVFPSFNTDSFYESYESEFIQRRQGWYYKYPGE